MAIVRNEHGKQDFLKTLNNYMEALQKSISVLELLRDSIEPDEENDIELVSSGNTVSIRGDPQLIERFVGFGIANYEEDNSDDSDAYDEDTDENTDDSN